MNRKQAQAMEPGTLIGEALAEYETEIPEISVDPRDIPLFAIRRIAKLKFPTPEKEREATALVRSFRPRIKDLIRNQQVDALKRAVDEMERAAKGLTVPDPILSVHQQTSEFRRTFRAMSWTTEEIDALRWFGSVGDKVSEIRISSVKIGDQVITRSQVREKLGRHCTNAHLREMERQEKEALELEANNRERAKRGENPYHREWA